MENNFFEMNGQGGYFAGTVAIQSTAQIGGLRSVFVDLKGRRNDLVFPSWGGIIQNPFKVPAKFYAGDLFEMRYDNKGEKPKLYLLKTYEVKSMSTVTVKIYRDEYRHVPCVGDVLMKAPTKIGGTGKAYTVQSVVEEMDSEDPVWTLTFNTQLDSCTNHDVLVEAEAESASGTMLVKTINAVAPTDGDMPFSPASGNYKEVNKARYYYTPVLGGTMYIHKMSPMPKCVLDMNQCRINGWYHLAF